MSARESRPDAVAEAASQWVWLTPSQVTGGTSGATAATHLRDAEPAVEQVWCDLASGAMSLAELRELSPPLYAMFSLGWQSGVDSQAARVAQAEHTANRFYALAMNEPARREAIERRLDRALASCPPNIEPHSPEYFEHVLRGAIGGGR